MAAISTVSMLDSDFDVDKLTYEIFSILENKFLFGYDEPKFSINQKHTIPVDQFKSAKPIAGKVRILSIDGGGATDGLLAAKSLAHLESGLRRKSGNPNACIADYFDVVAGSGAGGILAALLFTRGNDGGPMFTAEEAVKFVTKNRGKIFRSSPVGILRRFFRPAKAEKEFRRVFGDSTLKNTLKAVLIPCYDLTSRAPFVFSRADALEMDGYDFKMSDVSLATSAHPAVMGAVEMRSVDERTKIVAVGGGVAMNNPTSAAITHVLNNKQEFPFCNGVEDLLVVSLGNGESDFSAGDLTSSPAGFVKIAGDGASDMVDQAVSMAFGDSRTSNYVRIQANGIVAKRLEKMRKQSKKGDMLSIAEEMLGQKNVESVLFKGKKLAESTNLEKLEMFAGDLIKEQERRKTSILPTVVLKKATTSPRTSTATTLSTLSSSY
ncbi:patatin-like protein 6 [Cornus florida]|uniref:patatin-like protein 6 n=1 Tax=Cornus florida TaxID=4283 RepID=UPI00289B280E|nr:patatin-like protein 6 [Cornus florida]